jgi:hypothetical protein
LAFFFFFRCLFVWRKGINLFNILTLLEEIGQQADDNVRQLRILRADCDVQLLRDRTQLKLPVHLNFASVLKMTASLFQEEKKNSDWTVHQAELIRASADDTRRGDRFHADDLYGHQVDVLLHSVCNQ